MDEHPIFNQKNRDAWLLKRQRLAAKNLHRRKFDPFKLAQEILEWSLEEDSISICNFCCERGYLPSLLNNYKFEFPIFARAYALTKMRLAERRERMLNNNQLHYGTFGKYQRYYDPFLNEAENEREDRAAERKLNIAKTENANLALLTKLLKEDKISQED